MEEIRVAIYIGTSFILLLVVMSMALVFIAQRKRKEAELRLANEEIAQQKRLAQITVQAHESERQNIGKELHDDLGQHLTSIRMYLEESRMNNNQDKLSDAIESLSESISKCSNISRLLYPVTLHRFGLKKAIEQLVFQVNNNSNIDVSLEFNLEKLDQNIELHIFRVYQEQISNTIKHAQCTSISMQLLAENERLLLRYQDNGIGIDYENSLSGLGLHNIKTRVDSLGGELSIQSKNGYYCEIIIPT